ncbi:MAG: LptF/LptG family permease [Candidatus Omnitrophica bacterium]|nr:LptF/LptG family permease [Candidatus Omnitrophota bacterium]
MYILDKYIVSKTTKGYIFTFLAFLGLYIIVDLFTNLGDFLCNKMPFKVILTYYLHMIPLIFSTISPFSLLITVIYTLAVLNRNNEILGMRVFGFSLFRISAGIITLSIVISFLALFIQEKLSFNSQRKIADITLEYIKGKKVSDKELKNIIFKDKDMLFFISRFIPKSKLLEGVTIYKEDNEGNTKEELVASKIAYINGKWVAKDLTARNLDNKGRYADIIPVFWENKTIDLSLKPENLAVKKSLSGGFASSIFAGASSSLSRDFSSIKKLFKEIQRLKVIKKYGRLPQFIIEFNLKLAQPFFHFFLIIGVLPFALEIKKRKAGLSSLGLWFIFGFAYYVIFSISLSLGKAGLILPHLCVWVAPLCFSIVGVSGLCLSR